MPRNSRAHTLVEIMIALLILAIAVLGGAMTQVAALRATREALEAQRALGLLQLLAARLASGALDPAAIAEWRAAVAEQLPARPEGAAHGEMTLSADAAWPQLRDLSIAWGADGSRLQLRVSAPP